MLVPLNSHHLLLGPKKWGTPKTWIRILAPNDGFSVSTPEVQRTPPHKHWSRMRGCCWDGQRLSTPEMESLLQNRIPKGIADFCHKIPQNRKTKQQQKKHENGKDLKISQAYAYLCLPLCTSKWFLPQPFWSSFSLVESLGSSKGSSIISYCLVTKKLSTAWNVIIPNNPQYNIIYIYICIYIYIR